MIGRIALVLALAGALAAFAAASASAAVGLSPGVYVTRVTGATPAPLNGTWRLGFKGKHFTITRNGKPAAAGRVTISGRRVVFRDTAGSYRCPPSQAVGTYRWSLRQSSLTLSVVRDDCSGRKAILTNGFTRLARN
jgi:hypothetical protein